MKSIGSILHDMPVAEPAAEPVAVAVAEPVARPPAHDAWSGFDWNQHADLHLAKIRLVDLYNAESGAVVLAGKSGCGKTHMAQAIMRAYGVGAILIDEPRLMQRIRASYASRDSRNPLKPYQKAEMLILDDVGVAHVKQESKS